MPDTALFLPVLLGGSGCTSLIQGWEVNFVATENEGAGGADEGAVKLKVIVRRLNAARSMLFGRLAHLPLEEAAELSVAGKAAFHGNRRDV